MLFEYLLFLFLQDVFTVSVGNLPAGAQVLIQITYVAELQVEGEAIEFRIPGSVAPWAKTKALSQQLQVKHRPEKNAKTHSRQKL